MYNSDIPSRAELPTSRQLLRSTLIAIVAALAILITIVLPAEYNIDPTGVGRVLGLAQMGEIKVQLAEEAERDRQMDQNTTVPAPGSSLLGRVFAALVVSPASAQTASRQDVTTLTLTPGQGAEIKLVMKAGAKADYSWTVSGGVVNFDTHGDGGGKSISYEKGRAVPGDDGVLVAAFDGNHGWFWRNRGSADVTLTLKTSGAYAEIKRTD